MFWLGYKVNMSGSSAVNHAVVEHFVCYFRRPTPGEALKWGESFDLLLSHKCKFWTFLFLALLFTGNWNRCYIMVHLVCSLF